MGLFGALSRIIHGRSSRVLSTPPAVSSAIYLRDPEKCLDHADGIAWKLATRFHELFPVPPSAKFGSVQMDLHAAAISLWLIFAASETLIGIATFGSKPLAKGFGEDLRRAFMIRYNEVLQKLEHQIGYLPRTDDPFASLDELRTSAYPVTIARSEEYIIDQVLTKTFNTRPGGAAEELSNLLQVGIHSYAENLGFGDPYDVLRDLHS